MPETLRFPFVARRPWGLFLRVRFCRIIHSIGRERLARVGLGWQCVLVMNAETDAVAFGDSRAVLRPNRPQLARTLTSVQFSHLDSLMRRTTVGRITIAVALLGCCFAQVSAGQGGRKVVADEIGALGELRGPFFTVLNRAISAQEKRDWNALYQSQWPKAIEHASVERFVTVRQQREWDIVDFRLVRIDTVTPPTPTSRGGQWNVLGCVLIKENEKRRTQQAVIPVYFVDGAWFAGEVGLLIEMDAEAPPPPCRLADGVRLPRPLSASKGDRFR